MSNLLSDFTCMFLSLYSLPFDLTIRHQKVTRAEWSTMCWEVHHIFLFYTFTFVQHKLLHVSTFIALNIEEY